MKKRFVRSVAVLLVAVTFILSCSIPGFAKADEYVIDRSTDASAEDVRVYIDSLLSFRAYAIAGKIYLPVAKLMSYLGYSASIVSDDEDTLLINCEGLDFSCEKKNEYAIANYRYVMVPGGYRQLDGDFYLPSETFQYVFGLDFTVFNSGKCLNIDCSSAQLIEGKEGYYWKYNSEDILWMARVIYAESSRQCIEGKIAVGNVIMNRLADKRFPNNIYDIIFDIGEVAQFESARSGLNFTPTETARAAAYMAIDGVNLVDDAEYFVNPSGTTSTWHSKALDFVIQIGDHYFYADRKES